MKKRRVPSQAVLIRAGLDNYRPGGAGRGPVRLAWRPWWHRLAARSPYLTGLVLWFRCRRRG